MYLIVSYQIVRVLNQHKKLNAMVYGSDCSFALMACTKCNGYKYICDVSGNALRFIPFTCSYCKQYFGNRLCKSSGCTQMSHRYYPNDGLPTSRLCTGTNPYCPTQTCHVCGGQGGKEECEHGLGPGTEHCVHGESRIHD